MIHPPLQKPVCEMQSLAEIVSTVFQKPSNNHDSRLKLVPYFQVLLTSDDMKLQTVAASELRQSILDFPVTQSIDVSFCRDFLHCALKSKSKCSAQPSVHNESVWALALLLNRERDFMDTIKVLKTSSTPACLYNNSMIVHLFVDVLREDHICEDAMIALGQLARESVSMRDQCLNSGAVKAILQTLQSNPTVQRYRAAMFALSRFCIGRPRPKLEDLAPCFPLLTKLGYHDDSKIVNYVRDALVGPISVISAGHKAELQEALNAGCIQSLSHWLKHHNDPSLRKDVVLAFHNAIKTGSDEQVQAIVRDDVMPVLVEFMDCGEPELACKVIEAVGNILKVAMRPADCFTASGGVAKLKMLMMESDHSQIRSKAARVVKCFFPIRELNGNVMSECPTRGEPEENTDLPPEALLRDVDVKVGKTLSEEELLKDYKLTDCIRNLRSTLRGGDSDDENESAASTTEKSTDASWFTL